MEALETRSNTEGHASPRRISQLDSLRGLAAVAVVCHHWHNAFWITLPRWSLRPLFAGHEAVILFFVLSGYVLSLPAWANRVSLYSEYLVRRVSRIYLPYLAAALVAGVGCYFFGGSRLPLTPWFYATWQTPLSAEVIWQQFTINPRSVLNTAFWSLRYEMEMSLVFPFLCGLMTRMGRHSGVLLAAVTVFSANLMFHTSWSAGNMAYTLYYATFFIVGAALAREQALLNRVINGFGKTFLGLMIVLSVGMYCFGSTILHTQRSLDVSTMFGSCGLILLVQDPRLHLGLKSRLAEYLGRISYSLYLIHGTILFAGLDLLYRRVGLPALAAIYGVVTLVAAHLFCICVEEPSLKLGKRVARRMWQAKDEVPSESVPA